MKKAVSPKLFFITLTVSLFSCFNKSSDNYYRNGLLKERTYYLDDTIIENQLFSVCLIETYDSLGNISSKKKFLNDTIPFGRHFYYKNGILNYRKEYILVDGLFNSILNEMIDVKKDSVEISEIVNPSYFNSIKYYDNKGRFIKSKGTYSSIYHKGGKYFSISVFNSQFNHDSGIFSNFFLVTRDGQNSFRKDTWSDKLVIEDSDSLILSYGFKGICVQCGYLNVSNDLKCRIMFFEEK